MEERYITLNVMGLLVQVKMEDEGVVLDVFEGDEVVASTYQFYHELGITDITFESSFICGSCGEPCSEYKYNEEKDVDECPNCQTDE